MSDPSGTPEEQLVESDQDASGEMGVSSEREGPTGPGQHGTTGVRPVGPEAVDETDPAVPPEYRPGAEETNPEGIPPKAGYPSLDPRSDG